MSSRPAPRPLSLPPRATRDRPLFVSPGSRFSFPRSLNLNTSSPRACSLKGGAQRVSVPASPVLELWTSLARGATKLPKFRRQFSAYPVGGLFWEHRVSPAPVQQPPVRSVVARAPRRRPRRPRAPPRAAGAAPSTSTRPGRSRAPADISSPLTPDRIGQSARPTPDDSAVIGTVTMKVCGDERVRVLEGEWDVRAVLEEIVEGGVQEDPFYVLDLGDVVGKFRKWKQAMPRVEPFYAVKCNDDPTLLTTLAALGTGFDCASKSEIQSVMQLGVRPERIIFANPAKMASHIRYAGGAGVRTMTFDNETELMKMKHYLPDAKLVIRIRCDAADAQCPLGIKFGCDPVAEAPRLLKLAAVLGLDVVGVSFHVGSGARETGVYARAIQFARALFDMAACVGLANMRLLDIGGGFPGNAGTDIDEVAGVINAALERYFPEPSVQVIAEPGRFFAASAYTLACQVHSKREVYAARGGGDGADGSDGSEGEEAAEPHTMYFINDGVYGSFNCVLYDHQEVTPEPLKCAAGAPVGGGKARASSVWGPSCDGLDCVVAACALPPFAVGDWLLFRNMGAYTLPVASPFNGFPVPRVRAVIHHNLWSMLKGLWPLTEAHFVLGERVTGPQLPDEPAPLLYTPPASPPPPRPCDTVFVECALK